MLNWFKLSENLPSYIRFKWFLKSVAPEFSKKDLDKFNKRILNAQINTQNVAIMFKIW